MRTTHYLPLGLSAFFSVAKSQSSLNFCNRVYHSSLIVNDVLYVDGGELWSINNTDNTISNVVPNYLQWFDTSKYWSNSDSGIWNEITKPDNSTFNDASLFSDGITLYFFGGAISLAPQAPVDVPPEGTWRYNIAQNKFSEPSIAGSPPVQRIHIGASAQSSNKTGYYLGGAITPKSDPAFNVLPGAVPYMVQGLIEFDEDAVKLTNVSSSGMDQFGTMGHGYMNLIESLGDKGVLVAFGGFMNVAGVPQDLGNFPAIIQDDTLHNELNTVSVYDIANQRWYRQNTTGDIPDWRFLGCSIVVAAPDKSSYSVYVFGGYGIDLNHSDGNVYVLSIPSFRWIRVTTDTQRRVFHQCHKMGKHTMVVVGGIQPNAEAVQPETQAGCDSANGLFANGLGIFNLNQHSWATSYDPTSDKQYRIHPSISKVIGGNAVGGATLKIPQGGFVSKGLGTLLGVKVQGTSNSSNSTGSTPAHPKSTGKSELGGGAIAGIVIGAIAVILIVATIIAFFLIRRRRRRRAVNMPLAGHPVDRGASGIGGQQETKPSLENAWPAKNGHANGLPPQELDSRRAEAPSELDSGWRPAESGSDIPHGPTKHGRNKALPTAPS